MEEFELKFLENQSESAEVQANKKLMNDVNKVVARFDETIQKLAKKHNVRLKTTVALEAIKD